MNIIKKVNIIQLNEISKNIFQIKTTKEKEFLYSPGQAVFITYDNQKKPFTITSIPEDDFLEFIIKIYDEHNGFTKKLRNLKVNDELEISQPFGTISYKGEGLFIVGGTGITPFLSIIKKLQKENKTLEKSKLIYSSKLEEEIIKRDYLIKQFKENYKEIITSKEKRIDEELLKENLNYEYYYICGPFIFSKEIENILLNLGIKKEKIIK